MLTFEPTVSVGNLITIALALIAAVGAWYKVRGHLDLIEYRVEAIEKTLENLSEVLKSIANTDMQMALLNQRQTAIETLISTQSKELADLRRGEGWIQNTRRGNIDGEYKRD